MKYFVTKSINLKVLVISFIKSPCSIEYLYPLKNKFYKKIINLLEKDKNINFKRVRMGKKEIPIISYSLKKH